MDNMIPTEKAAESLIGKGFDNITIMKGGSFKKSRTIIVCPTRGEINHRIVSSWQMLIQPMNQARIFMFATGDEVGMAYNNMVNMILNHPEYSKWEYIMTVEDDNILPPDAQIRLLESMEETGADAVSGIYFTKGPLAMPMAYGDPNEFRTTGKLDFRPRKPEEITSALEKGHTMEVNGIAMGCGLWKMDLLRSVPPPWFVTVSDIVKDTEGNILGPQSFTQDLKFCDRAKRLGKKFYVDFRVKVGHLDINSGIVY